GRHARTGKTRRETRRLTAIVRSEEEDMSMRFIGALAAAVLALGGIVAAQNVPSQFVVSGKAAEQIQDFSTINLATAERIAEACERLAAAENVGITIDVLDNDGNFVYA